MVVKVKNVVTSIDPKRNTFLDFRFLQLSKRVFSSMTSHNFYRELKKQKENY